MVDAATPRVGPHGRPLVPWPPKTPNGLARAHVVGDVGPHAPDYWEGGLGGPDIHAMGWIRTDSDQGREEAMRIIRSEMEATGGVEIRFVQDYVKRQKNDMADAEAICEPVTSSGVFGNTAELQLREAER